MITEKRDPHLYKKWGLVAVRIATGINSFVSISFWKVKDCKIVY